MPVPLDAEPPLRWILPRGKKDKSKQQKGETNLEPRSIKAALFMSPCWILQNNENTRAFLHDLLQNNGKGVFVFFFMLVYGGGGSSKPRLWLDFFLY